jgi:hypothetical protein
MGMAPSVILLFMQNHGNEVDKFLSEQQSLEQRRMALIDAVLKERDKKS